MANATGLIALAAGLALRRRGYWMIGSYVLFVTATYVVVQRVTRCTYLLTLPLLFVAFDGLVRAATAARAGIGASIAARPGRDAPHRQVA